MKTVEVAYEPESENKLTIPVCYKVDESEKYPIYVEILDNKGLEWLNITSFRFEHIAKIDAVNKTAFDLPENISDKAFDFVTTQVHNAVLADIALVD
jgi:hypothetical protein